MNTSHPSHFHKNLKWKRKIKHLWIIKLVSLFVALGVTSFIIFNHYNQQHLPSPKAILLKTRSNLTTSNTLIRADIKQGKKSSEIRWRYENGKIISEYSSIGIGFTAPNIFIEKNNPVIIIDELLEKGKKSTLHQTLNKDFKFQFTSGETLVINKHFFPKTFQKNPDTQVLYFEDIEVISEALYKK